MNESVYNPLTITGLGMITSVGLTTDQTCAAIRGGVARFSESDNLVDRFGQPVVSARSPVRAGESGAERCARMVRAASSQSIRQIPDAELKSRPIAVYVLGDDHEPESAFSETFIAVKGALPDGAHVRRLDVRAGSAAGIIAVRDACKLVSEDPQWVVVIAAYQNRASRESLLRLESMGRLKSSSRPRGMIPGEAAAALVAESPFMSCRRNNNLETVVSCAAIAEEESPLGSPDPCLGTGLTAAIYECLQSAGWEPDSVGTIYCDLNGEEYRAHEWILARSRIGLDARLRHPADCIGDVGAAFAPLLLGIAAKALERGYGGAANALVWCSSDKGSRGAVCVSATAAR